jgi:hypothetical protein
MEAHRLALVTAGQVDPWQQSAVHQFAQFGFSDTEIGCGFVEPQKSCDLRARHGYAPTFATRAA